MTLRRFVFRVPRKRERAMVAFMRREALRLLRRIPACRAAYLLRGPNRKREYTWVTLWTSEAALQRALRRKDWQDVLRREEEAGFFAGRPRTRHYTVVSTK